MSETPPDPATDTEDVTNERTPESRAQGEPEGQKWLSGIISLIGLWIAVSPFVYDATETALWNNLLVGAAIFLVAGYNYYRIVTNHTTSVGAMTLVAILGLWALVAPWLVEYAADGLFWSTVVTGALVAILSGYVAYEANRAPVETRAEATDRGV